MCLHLKDLPSELLVLTLDTVRQRGKKHVEQSAEHLTAAMDGFTHQMQAVLDGMLTDRA